MTQTNILHCFQDLLWLIFLLPSVTFSLHAGSGLVMLLVPVQSQSGRPPAQQSVQEQQNSASADQQDWNLEINRQQIFLLPESTSSSDFRNRENVYVLTLKLSKSSLLKSGIPMQWMWSLSFLGPGDYEISHKERWIIFVFCVNVVKLLILIIMIIMIMMQSELMQCVKLFVLAIRKALLPLRSIIV